MKNVFHMKPIWDEKKSNDSPNGHGHMTKMAAMLKNAQNLTKFFLQNY